jgi:hypothetical protein
MKSIDKKILEELSRHNSINRYITEQEAEVGVEVGDTGTEVGTEVDTEVPTEDPMLEPAETTPEVIDVTQDDEVEKIGDDGSSQESESGSEEIDITDLVNSQKSMESKQNEYFDMMFKQLEGLQGKLSEMENLVAKLNDIEAKVEKYRPKTPQEKLELRSLDSGPFHQKLTDFFDDKQEDLEKSGKNEYVLTSDEVEQIIPSDIKKSFDTALPEPTDTRFGMR